ncbi:hypothetical protein SAMN05444392_1217 [Seinonella peptonophila]|uniref:Uncharacterized protein n=1 Tax=Seinonella peptonophila TaxID=112248 RepID=A0A1M5BCF3_9BACL|nr:hypothetical protein [Seinonella peptonophila]SHF40095.1 hypothetical protein SAMN05444392_1217 [Seinonella peptonophila]
MSNQRIIRKADLRTIEHNLTNIHSGIEHMYHYVLSMQNKVLETEAKLDKLSNDFYTYLQDELQSKQLQLAETRLVRVRQKLEKDFGHYDSVRRRATGILQAVDVGIVRDEIISSTTEELMLKTPKYWLSPCLVALSAWIEDKRELAEKALQEGFRRDSQKSSLFFALVMRRYERFEACSRWLESYFFLQDASALDREVIILLDAFTNGVFDPQSRAQSIAQMNQWMFDVTASGEELHKSWLEPLEKFIVDQAVDQQYPYLSQYSPTFDQCKKSLEFAHSHQQLLTFLQTVFSGEVRPVQKVFEAVDEMLQNLVTDYDEEELPLRQKDRLLNLIIEEDGKREIAEEKFSQEKVAWNQKFHFKDVMQTLAFFPQTVSATKATQRFAIAFCKDWLVNAYKDFTAEHRRQFPSEIEIEIEGWQGTTRDGTNQIEMVRSLMEYMKKKGKSKKKLKKKHYLAAVGGGLLSIFGIALAYIHPAFLLLTLLGLLGPGWFLWLRRHNKKVERSQFYQKQINAKNDLLATIAEIVDWRDEYTKADEDSKKVTEYIASIRKEQYVQTGFDQARAIHT